SWPKSRNTTPMPPSESDRPSLGLIKMVGMRFPFVGPGRRLRSLKVEQLQARGGDLLHRFNNGWENLVGDNFLWFFGKAHFQAFPPGKAQLGIDMHNSNPRPD